MFKNPTALKPEQVTAIVDTREQQPLDVGPLQSVRQSLPTGDYSVLGLENVVCVERKSLADLVQCVGRERRRFENVVHRLLAFPVRLLVVEATWRDLEAARWRGRVTATQVLGSTLSWISRGLPIVMAGNPQQAGRLVSRFLFLAARNRWRENLPFLKRMLNCGDVTGSPNA